MSMATRRLIGLAALGLAAVVILLIWVLPATNPPPSTNRTAFIAVRGIIGSEKNHLLLNERVLAILRERYRLGVEFTRMGSLEQVEIPAEELRDGGTDFLWPSNLSAQVVFEEGHDTSVFETYRAENVLNSPIVVYGWPEAVGPLQQAGLAQPDPAGYYELDVDALLRRMISGLTWEDLGSRQLSGPVRIHSTDPTRSNSGNMLYLLYANLLVEGDVATTASVRPVLPVLFSIYEGQGLQSTSSGFAFEAFLTQDVGANPLLAGYESQLLEYFKLHPQDLEAYAQRLLILYPRPTVWSSHPILALTQDGQRFLEAMQDPEVQAIAWSEHGFRSAVPGTVNDMAAHQVQIPEEIYSIVALPNPAVIRLVNTCLSTGSCPP